MHYYFIFGNCHSGLEEVYSLQGSAFNLLEEKKVFEMNKKTSRMGREDPVAILIVEESGVTPFSYKFKYKDGIDDQLIGAYLSAICSFGNEIFKGSGAIDQIIFHDFAILMRKVNSFTFCYIFQGDSYLALKRLEYFILQVRNTRLVWNNLRESVKTKRKLQLTTDSKYCLKSIKM